MLVILGIGVMVLLGSCGVVARDNVARFGTGYITFQDALVRSVAAAALGFLTLYLVMTLGLLAIFEVFERRVPMRRREPVDDRLDRTVRFGGALFGGFVLMTIALPKTFVAAAGWPDWVFGALAAGGLLLGAARLGVRLTMLALGGVVLGWGVGGVLISWDAAANPVRAPVLPAAVWTAAAAGSLAAGCLALMGGVAFGVVLGRLRGRAPSAGHEDVLDSAALLPPRSRSLATWAATAVSFAVGSSLLVATVAAPDPHVVLAGGRPTLTITILPGSIHADPTELPAGEIVLVIVNQDGRQRWSNLADTGPAESPVPAERLSRMGGNFGYAPAFGESRTQVRRLTPGYYWWFDDKDPSVSAQVHVTEP